MNSSFDDIEKERKVVGVGVCFRVDIYMTHQTEPALLETDETKSKHNTR